MATHDEITDFKPGQMDIAAQQKTFAGFIRFAIWVTGLSLLVLVFLALANA
ncbi:aa3-type cytochrome c oxidase subunit IV [Paracoccus marinaquae]|uniref:Aa3-type cytochrome c oxidase subunit IV n=1 Tax=Paracoccus marinaquae TaxID=2841926 RepID=A0ABS6AJ07_9RHOB|nr:aa3-type cytochrome c oxidase subunit IV [Paracoccus marinaquae]MBU3029635.1 aa3-type cytochrome c oxidase subunit IV [Paracoccus marinaquae]